MSHTSQVSRRAIFSACSQAPPFFSTRTSVSAPGCPRFLWSRIRAVLMLSSVSFGKSPSVANASAMKLMASLVSSAASAPSTTRTSRSSGYVSE
eukprot:9466534-Pyramimonas_sp.AAC.1